jgi:hypothetical protein
MYCDIYVTDWGSVRVSGDEARTLGMAADARRELAGSPFLDTPVAKRLFAREAAIIDACERVARHKFEAA